MGYCSFTMRETIAIFVKVGMLNDRLFRAFLSFTIPTFTNIAGVSHIVKLQLPNAPL